MYKRIKHAVMQGFTPLHTAAEFTDIWVAKVLLKAGARINAVGYGEGLLGLQGMNCLHHAVHVGHNSMVQLLLEHGADVAATDFEVCLTFFSSHDVVQFWVRHVCITKQDFLLSPSLHCLKLLQACIPPLLSMVLLHDAETEC